MSCELVDLSARAEDPGLEDQHEAVGDFRRSVSETVGHFNGFIARNLGNSALVLFGYPKADEHDPEHAVRAGLELCTMVATGKTVAGVPMRCRVGIATGNAIIGNLQGGALGDLDIVGDVPNLATQLRISAQPDIVAIDPTTRLLIGNLFDCRALGAIETRGAESMRGYHVLGESLVARRFEALRGAMLSPLVGRGEEIDLLLRRWARAKAGDGQIVLVSGEAGIGKSRLAAALEERLHGDPHLCLHYFCSPHHQDSALFPVIEQLCRTAGFNRDDPPSARWHKLETLLEPATLPDEDVALLADLLSLPPSERHSLPNLSPQRIKQRVLEALIRQLEGLACQQPVLITFEDAHWIDPTSRELLDLAIERARSLPVLLVVTFRPEFQLPWTGQPQVSTLALNRLDWRDRSVFVAQITGKTLPEEIVTRIADRSDGVPLFVEE
jgi:class 3 adenylate cyclase